MEAEERLRIDHYLHRARHFKSRTQAVEACREGRVLINGKVAQAASKVDLNDEIRIREKGLYKTIRILSIPGKNISKEQAKLTWRDETPDDVKKQREMIAVANRSRSGNQDGARPTKKERRDLDRLKNR